MKTSKKELIELIELNEEVYKKLTEKDINHPRSTFLKNKLTRQLVNCVRNIGVYLEPVEAIVKSGNNRKLQDLGDDLLDTMAKLENVQDIDNPAQVYMIIAKCVPVLLMLALIIEDINERLLA